jgi:hypothetical protein
VITGLLTMMVLLLRRLPSELLDSLPSAFLLNADD